MANVEFGTGKSVVILTIVAACFAILWPKIFYPMISGTQDPIKPVDVSSGCCDVVFEKDVEAVRVLSDMCGQVNGMAPGAAITPAGVATCRALVLERCDIDIATFLNEQARLGRSYRQILDELRSFNTSVCLRRHFGVSPNSLGAPRRMRTWGPATSRHLRQERPPHLRPDVGVHPALRERGQAIPASHIVPKITVEKDSAIKPPLPGMRPPMGGAGHVVPAPKTGGTMSIVMPLYTIGIVIFFMYTMMKMFVRKSSGDDGLRDFQPDPEFRRVVFAEDEPKSEKSRELPRRELPPQLVKAPSTDTTRLGWKERDTRDVELDQLRRRLEETERAMERIVAQMGKVPRMAAIALQQEVKEIKPEVVSTEPEPEPAGKTTEQAVIDDASLDGEPEGDLELNEEGTHYTTANTAANPSAPNADNSASGKQDAEADDTAADLSAQDFLDDQEDLQEEYDAIWGAMEMEDDGASNEVPIDLALGQQHQR